MDEIEFIKSNKGGLKIIHKGYMYTVHKHKKNGGVRWRCANRRYNCKGSISTETHGGSPTLNMPHNHLPDLYSLAMARQKRDESVNTLQLHPIFDHVAESQNFPLSNFVPEVLENSRNVWEPQTILDSMPLQQRITKQSVSSESQEPVLQSQPLSPTKLKVTRQAKTPSATPKAPTPEPPNEEVCLRWNSHHANMQTAFPSLLLKEQYVDATLVADGKTLKCHRMILSSCSTYFEEVLSGISPFQHPVIFMKDIPFWILKSLCDFMYAGEVHIFQNKLEELLSVAEVLKIKGLAGKTDTNEDVKPTIEPKKEEERPKEIKEEKKKEEKKKHQPAQPVPKEEPPPKVVTPKPSTSKASHSVRKPEKAKEKEKTPIKKDENITDPLDLLEPMYEEEVTKEPPKSNTPVKTQEKKSVPVKKPVGKKVKKRRLNEEREESPPPFMQQRKGTRSRPNVKIPKYYHTHYDPLPKDAQDATIVREPHTTSASSDLLIEVEEIKAEPIDVEDDVIEIEDNVVSFSDQDVTSQDGEEEIIGNYDSPIVNIKKEKVAKEALPAFKPISLVAQPVILNVHTVSESTATPSSSTKTDPQQPVVSNILISNIQSLKESEIIDVDKNDDLDKSQESNELAFKIESVVSESSEASGGKSDKTVKLEAAEKVTEKPIKSEESGSKDSKTHASTCENLKTENVEPLESSERLEINTMEEFKTDDPKSQEMSTDFIEISDDDVNNTEAQVLIADIPKENAPEVSEADSSMIGDGQNENEFMETGPTKEVEEESESGFKGFKDIELHLLQSDDDAVSSNITSQNVDESSLLNLDEDLENSRMLTENPIGENIETLPTPLVESESLQNVEGNVQQDEENMDTTVIGDNDDLENSSRKPVEYVKEENIEKLSEHAESLQNVESMDDLNDTDVCMENLENIGETSGYILDNIENLGKPDEGMESLPKVDESSKDLANTGTLYDTAIHEENLQNIEEPPKDLGNIKGNLQNVEGSKDLDTYNTNSGMVKLTSAEEQSENQNLEKNKGLDEDEGADKIQTSDRNTYSTNSDIENFKNAEENKGLDEDEGADKIQTSDRNTCSTNSDIEKIKNAEEKSENQDFEKNEQCVDVDAYNVESSDRKPVQDSQEDFEIIDELDENDYEYEEISSSEKPSTSSGTPSKSPEKTLEMIVNDLNESLKAGDDIPSKEDLNIPGECTKSVEEQIDDLWEQMSDDMEKDDSERKEQEHGSRDNSDAKAISDSSIEMSNVLQDVPEQFEKNVNEETDVLKPEMWSEEFRDSQDEFDQELHTEHSLVTQEDLKTESLQPKEGTLELEDINDIRVSEQQQLETREELLEDIGDIPVSEQQLESREEFLGDIGDNSVSEQQLEAREEFLEDIGDIPISEQQSEAREELLEDIDDTQVSKEQELKLGEKLLADVGHIPVSEQQLEHREELLEDIGDIQVSEKQLKLREEPLEDVGDIPVSEEQQLERGEELLDDISDIQVSEEQLEPREESFEHFGDISVSEEQFKPTAQSLGDIQVSEQLEPREELLEDIDIRVSEEQHVEPKVELMEDIDYIRVLEERQLEPREESLEDIADISVSEEQQFLKDDEVAVEEPQTNVRKRCRGEELDAEIRSLMSQQNPEPEFAREAKKQKPDTPDASYSENELSQVREDFGAAQTIAERTESDEMESSLPGPSQEMRSRGGNETGQDNVEATSTVTEQGRIDDALRELYRKTIGERKLI